MCLVCLPPNSTSMQGLWEKEKLTELTLLELRDPMEWALLTEAICHTLQLLGYTSAQSVPIPVQNQPSADLDVAIAA